MINASSFVPGRVYSLVYDSAVEMVGKREFSAETITQNPALQGLTLVKGKLENPYVDLAVTVRRVSTVQAAGGETWERFKVRNGMNTEPSNRAPWCHESDENACILIHNVNGQKYLRGIPRGVSKEEYFDSNGNPLDAKVLAIVKAFKKGSSQGDKPLFVTLRLDNLVNVKDEICA